MESRKLGVYLQSHSEERFCNRDLRRKSEGLFIGVWRSWLAHLVWDQRVLCSSHSTPTVERMIHRESSAFFSSLPPGTPNLSTIICLRERPAEYVGKQNTNNKAGSSSGKNIIYVPKGCTDAYKTAWAELVNDGWTIQENNK